MSSYTNRNPDGTTETVINQGKNQITIKRDAKGRIIEKTTSTNNGKFIETRDANNKVTSRFVNGWLNEFENGKQIRTSYNGRVIREHSYPKPKEPASHDGGLGIFKLLKFIILLPFKLLKFIILLPFQLLCFIFKSFKFVLIVALIAGVLVGGGFAVSYIIKSINVSLATYQITYNLDGGTNNLDNPFTYNIQDSEIILKTPYKEGYYFMGWFEDELHTQQISTIATDNATDITVYAKWQEVFEVENSTIVSLCDYVKENIDDINLVIPNQIDGTSITAISANAFENCTNIISVEYGKDVSNLAIGENAFLGCSNISQVAFNQTYNGITFENKYSNPMCYGAELYQINQNNQKSLLISINFSSQPYYDIEIKPYQYYGCESLTLLYIGKNISCIGKSAFENCTNLKELQLNINYQLTIEENAFKGCSKITHVFNKSELYNWLNIIFENQYANPLCNNAHLVDRYNYYVEYVTITKTVNDYAFYNCKSLKEIEFSGYVDNIGKSAFENCSNLELAIISNSVSVIKTRAFYNCSNLTYLTFKKDYSCLQTIESYAFYNCNKLTLTYFPASLTSIGEYAFAYCSALETMHFARYSQFKTFGACSFYNCTSLEFILIPETVTDIGNYAFTNCSSIKYTFYGGASKAQFNANTNVGTGNTFKGFRSYSESKPSTLAELFWFYGSDNSYKIWTITIYP